MMTNKFKFFYSVLFLSALFTIAGCKANIEVKANTDSSANLSFDVDLGSEITQLIQSFSEMATQTDSTVIFDSKQIKETFNNTDFKNIEINTPEKSRLIFSGTVPSPGQQKQASEKGDLKIANFLTCKQDSLTLILSPDTIQQITASLPEDNRAYLDLLMAPVITKEEMNPQEYKDLIACIYGEELADVLEKAEVKVTLIPPQGKTIKKASLSGTIQSKTLQNKAVFTIPLSTILTLDKAETFSITY